MSILIISSKVDPTTDEVIDWLDFYEKKFTRIEINELFQKQSVNFFLSEGSSGLHFFIENRKVNVSSAWIRADSSYKPKPEFNSNNKELVQLVEKHLEKEFRELKRGVLNSTSLKKIRWLNSYYKLNKIRVLAEAKKVGLKIPKTLITNNKVDLLQFLEGCEKIICKAISSSLLLKTEKLSNPYFQYTNEVKKEDLDKLPDSFFPSLFQELIEKMIDVRLVFIREKVFPVGIFPRQ